MLKPVVLEKPFRFREAAYSAIKEAILSNQLEPGAPLIEEQLGALLQISRTPVREALSILEHEGLLATRNGRGLYVREVAQEEFIMLFTANEVVEPFLVRQAALVAANDHLLALQRIVDEGIAAAASHDLSGLLRSGRNFHGTVGMASGNIPLAEFVIRNEERVDLFLMSYRSDIPLSSFTASNEEHAAILEAIRSHDPEAAAQLSVQHSQSVRRRLVQFFGD